MPSPKIIKIKNSQVSKKLKTPRSKKVSRSTKHVTKEEGAVLLSTEIHGSSVTHGHTPYHHNLSQAPVKKMDEHTQRLIMYLGISLIMIIIVMVWILNLKSVIGPDAFSIAPAQPQNQVDFENIKNDLSKTFSEIKGGIQGLEDLSKAKEIIPTSTTSPIFISDTAKPVVPNTLPN